MALRSNLHFAVWLSKWAGTIAFGALIIGLFRPFRIVPATRDSPSLWEDVIYVMHPPKTGAGNGSGAVLTELIVYNRLPCEL